jgi:DNA-directed RNA polymerase specialized sigma subunit
MTLAARWNGVKSLAFIRRLCWEKLFVVIALFGLLSTQATAASFDCNKAASWVEKSVCSNAELSKLDDQLAKSYHDALASLSERESYIILNRVMADTPQTLQEIGDKYRVKRERIRQIEKQALKKVRLAFPELASANSCSLAQYQQM